MIDKILEYCTKRTNEIIEKNNYLTNSILELEKEKLILKGAFTVLHELKELLDESKQSEHSAVSIAEPADERTNPDESTNSKDSIPNKKQILEPQGKKKRRDHN